WPAAAGRAPDCRCSAQLAVLAAAPVVAAEALLLGLVELFLADHAQPHARQRLSASLGDRLAALLALAQAFAFGNATAHPRQPILDRAVDLILHGIVPCPTAGHQRHASGWCSQWPGSGNSGCSVGWSMFQVSSSVRLSAARVSGQSARSATTTCADSATRSLATCQT